MHIVYRYMYNKMLRQFQNNLQVMNCRHINLRYDARTLKSPFVTVLPNISFFLLHISKIWLHFLNRLYKMNIFPKFPSKSYIKWIFYQYFNAQKIVWRYGHYSWSDRISLVFCFKWFYLPCILPELHEFYICSSSTYSDKLLLKLSTDSHKYYKKIKREQEILKAFPAPPRHVCQPIPASTPFKNFFTAFFLLWTWFWMVQE